MNGWHVWHKLPQSLILGRAIRTRCRPVTYNPSNRRIRMDIFAALKTRYGGEHGCNDTVARISSAAYLQLAGVAPATIDIRSSGCGARKWAAASSPVYVPLLAPCLIANLIVSSPLCRFDLLLHRRAAHIVNLVKPLLPRDGRRGAPV